MGKGKLQKETAGAGGVGTPPRVAPVVITIVFDPESGNLAITPVYEISADGLIHVLQDALRQVTAFAAIEHARRQQSAPEEPHTGE